MAVEEPPCRFLRICSFGDCASQTGRDYMISSLQILLMAVKEAVGQSLKIRSFGECASQTTLPWSTLYVLLTANLANGCIESCSSIFKNRSFGDRTS